MKKPPTQVLHLRGSYIARTQSLHNELKFTIRIHSTYNVITYHVHGTLGIHAHLK